MTKLQQNVEIQTVLSLHESDKINIISVNYKTKWEKEALKQWNNLIHLKEIAKQKMTEMTGNIYDLLAWKDVILTTKKLTNPMITDLIVLCSKIFRRNSELYYALSDLFSKIFVDQDELNVCENRLLHNKFLEEEQKRETLNVHLELIKYTSSKLKSDLEKKNNEFEQLQQVAEDLLLKCNPQDEQVKILKEKLGKLISTPLPETNNIPTTESEMVDSIYDKLKFLNSKLSNIVNLENTHDHVNKMTEKYEAIRKDMEKITLELEDSIKERLGIIKKGQSIKEARKYVTKLKHTMKELNQCVTEGKKDLKKVVERNFSWIQNALLSFEEVLSRQQSTFEKIDHVESLKVIEQELEDTLEDHKKESKINENFEENLEDKKRSIDEKNREIKDNENFRNDESATEDQAADEQEEMDDIKRNDFEAGDDFDENSRTENNVQEFMNNFGPVQNQQSEQETQQKTKQQTQKQIKETTHTQITEEKLEETTALNTIKKEEKPVVPAVQEEFQTKQRSDSISSAPLSVQSMPEKEIETGHPLRSLSSAENPKEIILNKLAKNQLLKNPHREKQQIRRYRKKRFGTSSVDKSKREFVDLESIDPDIAQMVKEVAEHTKKYYK